MGIELYFINKKRNPLRKDTIEVALNTMVEYETEFRITKITEGYNPDNKIEVSAVEFQADHSMLESGVVHIWGENGHVSVSNDELTNSVIFEFWGQFLGGDKDALISFLHDLQSKFGLPEELRECTIKNSSLSQSTSIREDIPFYFIPNITLNWKTVLNPENYAEYWDREVLVKAPAYEVSERENGWIEIQTYRDLFDPLSEESLGQIRNLACYLEKYNKEAWDSVFESPQLYEGGDQRPGCADCEYE